MIMSMNNEHGSTSASVVICPPCTPEPGWLHQPAMVYWGPTFAMSVSSSQEEKTQQCSLGSLETLVSLQHNVYVGDTWDEAIPTTLTICTNLGAIFFWPWLLPDGFHIPQKQNPGFWFYRLH